MIKVGVVGYGTIGQRLANAVFRQEDMQLVGVADIKSTPSIIALRDLGMPFDLYLASSDHLEDFRELEIPISGMLSDLLYQCDIVLDASPAGEGLKNKKNYIKYGKKAVFQGGEDNAVADVLFHGYANYDRGYGADFLKISNYNINGLTRVIGCLDRAYGIESVSLKIIDRNIELDQIQNAETLNQHCLTKSNQLAQDFMQIMPHIDVQCQYEYTSNPDEQSVTINAIGKKNISRENTLIALKAHERIRIENRSADNSISLFQTDIKHIYSSQDDEIYKIVVWEDSLVEDGKCISLVTTVPPQTIIIPETIDAIRACCKMQPDSYNATTLTNTYLRLGKRKIKKTATTN